MIYSKTIGRLLYLHCEYIYQAAGFFHKLPVCPMLRVTLPATTISLNDKYFTTTYY
jgi:hypothetical protein